jgi:hypothetical protein
MNNEPSSGIDGVEDSKARSALNTTDNPYQTLIPIPA